MIFKILTLGCKLNFAESSALGKVLLSRGHQRAKAGEQADVIIVNTCTVTDTADHKDRQAIHRLKRENPNAKIFVTGCYAALLKGKKDKNELSEADQRILEEIDHLMPKDLETFHGAYSRDDRTRCFLKVQDGCNYFCTYCTIPFARGRSRNPYIKDIVAQAQQALNEGAKEIILTGVNIGDFGRSTGETFLELLKALDSLEPGNPDGCSSTGKPTEGALASWRCRISSCEPNLLSDDIIDFVAHSKHFAPHFHIPLQSGSNEVLRIMNRHYTRKLFAERVYRIKSLMPQAFIGVDCMVGVRGETDACFEDYVAFLATLPVSQLHVFTYSERANTRMLNMDLYVVPMKERERRSQVLHQMSEQKLRNFYNDHIGDQVTVLWESKKAGDRMFGFTENYIKLSAPYDKIKVNTFEVLTIHCYTIPS